MSDKQVSLLKFLERKIAISSLKGALLAAPVSFFLICLATYFSTKQIFTTRLEGAVAVHRTQILSGETKRAQLSIAHLLGDQNNTSIEIIAKSGAKVAPDIHISDRFRYRLSVSETIPIYFDESKNSAYGFVVGRTAIDIPWYIFSAMAISVLLFILATLYLSRKAIREVGTELTTMVRSIPSGNRNTGVVEFEEIATSVSSLHEKLALIDSSPSATDDLRRFAHDMRGPLSAIALAISTVDNIPLKAKGVLERAFSRATSMTDGALGTRESEMASTLSFLNDLISEKEEKASRSQIKIQRNIDADVEMSSAHCNEIQRVASNILDNAIEASKANETILIRSFSTKTHWYLEIQDQGEGIPIEQQDRILRGGFSTKTSGHGVGLSSAKATMTRLGGSLQFHHQTEGFVVSISIPLRA